MIKWSEMKNSVVVQVVIQPACEIQRSHMVPGSSSARGTSIGVSAVELGSILVHLATGSKQSCVSHSGRVDMNLA